MKVIKFGGSSLANGAAVAQAIRIIQADPARQVIVTSAPGKRHHDDTKVTDLLIQYAQSVQNQQNSQAIIKEIFDRYQAIAAHFNLPASALTPIKGALNELPNGDYPTAAYRLATFKAHGERLNAQLLAAILNHLGLKARFVDPKEIGIMVTGTPNNAMVAPETYHLLADFQLAPDERIVVPGFFGFTMAGYIATFSRGGSDVTGAILARGLGAERYENFTDVDAIFAVDPKLVAAPAPIKVMTYREMRELSYAGFSVFHDEALLPAIAARVPINVQNTLAPDKPGTMIVTDRDFTPTRPITGIAAGKHFAALYLHKYLLNKEAGFTLQILKILDAHEVPYEHMPSGIDDITIVFDQHHLTPELVDEICDEIQTTINPDRLEWINEFALITIVGEGMASSPTIPAEILATLAHEKIAVQMINQGASKIATMIGTDPADCDRAVQVIYNHFFN